MAKDPFKQLDVIKEASTRGYRVKDCYRLMFKKELWIKAYAKLAPHPGNLTKGTENQTIDGFSFTLVDKIIKQLKERKFRFSPVRRVYIQKKNGKKRPLGIPNFKEKLVQEVMRMILEQIYEPIFSEDSHGFRPERSCHTALSQIKNTWRGLTWCIEGDIKGFFDNIDHRTIISILEKKIQDRRFILLIHNALKCGYLEDWKFHQTYSGTPQGGIASPILANIYLNELDSFIKAKAEQFNKGSIRKRNNHYRAIRAQIEYHQKVVERQDERNQSQEWENRDYYIEKIRTLRKQQREINSIDPVDPDYRRMRYVRYADDFVIGLAGSKNEAKAIKSEIKEFLNEHLQLNLSEEKTLITHLENKVQFLGYQFSKWDTERVIRVKYKNYTRPIIKRTLSGEIKLEIPQDKLYGFSKKNGYGNLHTLKSIHRGKYINHSDIEILYTYNAELRGIANYYKLANNYHHLDPLFHIARYSFLKTLAGKRKSTVGKIAKALRQHLQGEMCILVKQKGGERKPHKLVQLKHLPKTTETLRHGSPTVDVIPNTMVFSSTTELERRLTVNQCEACGKTEGTMEVHHVRKLKDIRKKTNQSYLDKIMIERKRKTLVLCYECHHAHHERQIPINQLESRMQ